MSSGKGPAVRFRVQLLVVGFALALGAAHQANAAPEPAFFRLPDLRVGLGDDNQGDTIPGPTRPNGSIHPSPATLKPSNAGYNPAEPISGFAQLHSQGSGGVTTYGTFLLSPQVGEPVFDEAAHLSPKANETLAADVYSVRLTRYDTKVEITPAHYAAIYRLTYPTTDQAQVVLDVTRKVGGLVASEQADVQLFPEQGRIIGHVKAKGYWNPALIDIWFVAEFDQNPTAWGVFDKAERRDGALSGRTGADERLGAWLTFKTTPTKPLLVKIAVSFVSAEMAKALLDREIPDWDFERVRRDTQAAWNDRLGQVRVEGMTESQQRRFYSALYHASTHPRDRSLDQPASRLGRPNWDEHYTLWDTYRTLFPLMSVLRPSLYTANVNSLIHTFDKFGAADTAIIGGQNYHVGQGGDEVDNVLGEALLRGAEGVNWHEAWRVARFNAFERRCPRYLESGYFAVGDRSPEPNNQRAKSGSSTLGFALNDFYAAQLATKSGRADEAKILTERSANWRKIWNPDATSDGFSGFLMPRYADGKFQDIDPKLGWDGKAHNNVGYYEGTAWIYSYGVLHDLPGLVEAMGGRVRFNERLNHALDAGLIDITNEPSFATPWLFHAIGRADLSSRWAGEVIKHFTADAYPGDEDAGAMSSNFVFNSLGLFPKLGSDLYYLHGPRHGRTVIQLENGKTLEILAAKAGASRPYIASASFNGKPLAGPYFSQAQLLGGGVLSLSMSDQPGQWIYEGAVLTARADQPSLVDGKTSTGWRAAPGQSVTLSLKAPACIAAYSVSVGPDEADPSHWTLQAYDGRAWVSVDQQSNVVFDHRHATRTFPLAPGRYTGLRLALDGGSEASLSEVELIAGASCAAPASRQATR
ncbi:GH92 family glycosyl hydrolase [Caulobacter sp. SL161]|uniref:GH92 family glycosyl hydrolase n=1 Tax=Caulobacter sp. SL161 TaxID=2995156 RepID=UPI002274F09F|nr:GH92 family glycosyl hydrolase [Caulobacter sp. SL161]MCY1647390.1 GH92 family glycosyl hydrolase [Caulobacter sp. SL161]